jgi:peptidoglycan L-alanyl-D-glutamate endopeptidase CwlK
MRDITALHPILQEKVAKLKKECSRQGIKILFSECLRTKAEQDALYAKGRTKPGSIVTNAKGSTYSSQHQWGIAIDFYIDMDVDGDGSKADDAFNNSTKLFDRVGSIAKNIGLGWGGDWTSIKDRPHLYLPDWGSTTSKLKKVYGTPDNFMKSWNNSEKAIEAVNKKADTGYERTEFIMDVQAATGSKVDGKAGKETIGNTVTVSADKNRKHAVVKPLQKRLNALGYDCGKADGIAGPKFTKAVKEYQKKVLGYKNPDGEITAKKKMWKSLLGMI